VKRLTRKIGLFGGPGALMSPMGGKKSVPAGSVSKPDPTPAAGTGASPQPPPARKGWLRRLLLGDDD
jgi:hypothetical protein